MFPGVDSLAKNGQLRYRYASVASHSCDFKAQEIHRDPRTTAQV